MKHTNVELLKIYAYIYITRVKMKFSYNKRIMSLLTSYAIKYKAQCQETVTYFGIVSHWVPRFLQMSCTIAIALAYFPEPG